MFEVNKRRSEWSGAAIYALRLGYNTVVEFWTAQEIADYIEREHPGAPVEEAKP